jgi:hypothetical protein
LTVQLPSAANDVGQEFVSAKSPLVAILVRIRSAVPVLVKITLCAALVVPTDWPAKVSLLAESVTVGALKPTPASVMVWGLLAALSVSVTDP